MLNPVIVFLISSASLTIPSVSLNKCNVPISSLRTYDVPLFFHAGAKISEKSFVKARGGRMIFRDKENVKVVCPIGKTNVNTVTKRIQCLNSKFVDDGQYKDLKDIKCQNSRSPVPITKVVGHCKNAFLTVSVGFQIDDVFLNRIESCYDNNTRLPLYTKSILDKSVSTCPTGRTGWYSTGTFRIMLPENIEDIYTIERQRQTVNQLLGLPLNDQSFIGDGHMYFARGHLTPKCDFTYPSEQRLTHNYFNAAPQWQQFNAGNWKVLEARIKDFVTKSTTFDYIVVYTGTYGITKFNNIDIYLYNGQNIHAVPVPQYFWKIIYEPISKKATVFVINNNPKRIKTQAICTSFCDTLGWLMKAAFQPRNIMKGITFCCAYTELISIIPNLPDIKVLGSLL
ncbi:uncharacterized protein LOC108734632 [Agrilus planipennis]|uniref:Uncharacterized protein LOC108734632 n=1 Tax=Agrilus planipennis TaxID=224129 RepID=A0A1W4WNT4_AGRPL|nr:uncharacterized protein LOC108734632 [Agrilus planipennis]